MNMINPVKTKYFFVIVVNDSHWYYFNAAVLPGHEEDMKCAILADVKASRDYEIDNIIRLYNKMRDIRTISDRITRECTYDIKVGDITCVDDRGEEEMAKALPLEGETFAFKLLNIGSFT